MMKHKRTAKVAVLAAALAASDNLAAQTPNTQSQSSTRAVMSVSLDGARRALAAAEAEARKNGWNMSIAVVDPAGELVAFARMDGAHSASVDISRAKARTAARFRRPTKALEDAVAGGRMVLLSFEGATLVEGGVPIVVNGEVVGAVGASGGSSPQDGQVALAGTVAAGSKP
jgi:glc operon protein GlcG